MKPIPSDLAFAIEHAYIPSGLLCTHFEKEVESEEYSAFTFEMNSLCIKFRTGKITPTKVGQFVTLWKRIGSSVILPHDLADPFDFFVISVREGENLGQFVFSKNVLYEKGIVSKEQKGGKRAMRIYPRWDIAENRQAKASQKWQLDTFFEIPANKNVDTKKVQSLFTLD